MKKYDKLLLIELVLLALATALAVLLTGRWQLIFIGAALAANFYLFLHLERRKYEKELEQISISLENLVAEDRLLAAGELSDTLTAKVRHQLLRLQSMVNGCREKAEKDNREIRDLIVEIAHQLRMPLANIETYLELLQAEQLTSAQKEQYISAVRTSEQQISFLIESFIKMARLETKIIQIKKESTDLNGTVMAAILQMEKAAREKNLEIEFSQEGEVLVLHDKNWLGEAVGNLIDNSIKYSPEDSKIQVSVTRNEMFAQILVRDYGMGIKEEEEQEIFKRFYRGKNVTDQKGFGLGMYLSREILFRHDGFIKVKRETPGLSCFVYLPFGEM